MATTTDADECALAYDRYSTDGQSSSEEQHAMNVETAADLGITILARYSDKAVSRSVADRDGLVRLLEHVASDPRVTTVIIPQMDRLIGDLQQHMTIFRAFGRKRIELWTYDGQVDYTSEDGLTRAEQDSLNSAAEVRRARKRTRKALRAKARAGRYTSRPPFGLRMSPILDADGNPVPKNVVLLDEKGRAIRSGTLEIDPDTIDHLQSVFTWIAAGVGTLEVCRRLVRAGAQTKNGKTEWNTQSINRIIRNRTYIGEHVWGRGHVVRDYDGHRYELRDPESREIIRRDLGWSAIGMQLWLDANAVMDHRLETRARSKSPDAPSKYPPRALDGLVFCERCGMRMKVRRDSKRLADGSHAKTWRYICLGQSRAVQGYQRKMKDGALRAYCQTPHSLAETSVLDALRGLPMRASGDVGWTFPATTTDESKERAKQEMVVAAAKTSILNIQMEMDDTDPGEDLSNYQLRISRQKERIGVAQEKLAQLSESGVGVAETMPTHRVVKMQEAMTVLLVNAREDYATDAETTAVRREINAVLSEYIERIEINAPHVAVVARRIQR